MAKVVTNPSKGIPISVGVESLIVIVVGVMATARSTIQ